MINFNQSSVEESEKIILCGYCYDVVHYADYSGIKDKDDIWYEFYKAKSAMAYRCVRCYDISKEIEEYLSEIEELIKCQVVTKLRARSLKMIGDETMNAVSTVSNNLISKSLY
jgi:hypothetical protein